MTRVEIYTDGACSGNPGPGGWGAILIHDKGEKDLSGGAAATTNNQMELTAAIKGLEALNRPCKVNLHTDSKYVKDGITKWIKAWVKNDWRTAAKKPVKNTKLWQRLLEAADKHDVKWHWVKGHSGHLENERADQLAREAMEPFKRQHKR